MSFGHSTQAGWTFLCHHRCHYIRPPKMSTSTSSTAQTSVSHIIASTRITRKKEIWDRNYEEENQTVKLQHNLLLHYVAGLPPPKKYLTRTQRGPIEAAVGDKMPYYYHGKGASLRKGVL